MNVTKVQNNNIIIFGTGEFARNILRFINIQEVFAFIDNSEEKIGTLFYDKPVYSLESISSVIDLKECQIFIASMFYDDISQQLSKIDLIEGVHFKDASECLPIKLIRENYNIDIDIEDEFIEIFIKVRRYTMTSLERMYALYQAVKYVILNKIPGAFVECGVWRGGSAMLIAETLMKLGHSDRDIYLYDTFEGFIDTELSENDITYFGVSAEDEMERYQEGDINLWCNASIQEVKKNLGLTLYPNESIHYIIGKVEDTLVDTTPSQISLLRLDTDFYVSTYQELNYLYPLLEINGVLIVDDFGHWQGAREAVMTYFNENGVEMLLNKVDLTGRIGIKI